MNISNYTGYFHDGSILNIETHKSSIAFTLESAVLDPSEIPNPELLSKSKTFIGKLHLMDIKRVEVDKKPFLEPLSKTYDSGEILDLELGNKTVFFLIEWMNYPPNKRESNTNTIWIEAEEIEWENLPNFKTRD
ncbi:MAG: hypothetical protein H7A38_02440 [Chlamydiales bacterium]|nr:hypothetical protein [Chlamydiales bacterium]